MISAGLSSNMQAKDIFKRYHYVFVNILDAFFGSFSCTTYSLPIILITVICLSIMQKHD